VLASDVVVLDDVVDPVAAPLVDVVDDVERAAFVFVPPPDVVAVTRPPVELAVVLAVVVTDAEVVGRVALVGRTVPLGRGRVGPVVGPLADVVGTVVDVAVAVVVGGGTVTKLLMIVDSHVTREPAAVEPLH
jgi:hypothetical protein